MRRASAGCWPRPRNRKKKNLQVGVGLQRRHQLNYLETIKRLQDGAIGDIVCRCAFTGTARRLGCTPARGTGPSSIASLPKWSTRCATGTTSPGSAATTSSSSTFITSTSATGSRMATRSRPTAWAAARCATDKDYGEIFDHHFVEFEYADGTRMFSQCRHIPTAGTA